MFIRKPIAHALLWYSLLPEPGTTTQRKANRITGPHPLLGTSRPLPKGSPPKRRDTLSWGSVSETQSLCEVATVQQSSFTRVDSWLLKKGKRGPHTNCLPDCFEVQIKLVCAQVHLQNSGSLSSNTWLGDLAQIFVATPRSPTVCRHANAGSTKC